MVIYRIKKGYPYPKQFIKVFSFSHCAYVITERSAEYVDIVRCELQYVADRLNLNEAVEKIETLAREGL